VRFLFLPSHFQLFRIAKISDAVSIGEVVPVVIKEKDEKGRYNLSIKGADPDFASRKGIAPQEGNYGGRQNRGEERRGEGANRR